MDIFEEADNILQEAQAKQNLEAIIESQQHIIQKQDQIAFLLYELCKLMTMTVQKYVGEPEHDDDVKAAYLIPVQLQGLVDQLNAAREELRALEEPDH